LAASAVFLLTAATAAQAAGPGGHTLPTTDGRCAVWVSTETGPRPGESARWSGACRDGLGQGLGILERVHADGSRHRYVGPLRDGRRHGLGRLHHWDAEGKLLHVVEGVFQNDIEQGVFQEIVTDHLQNGPIEVFRQTGRDLGRRAVQVQQFYSDGAAVLMCGPEADCAREAAVEGYTTAPPDLGGDLSRLLPHGGWRLERRSGDRTSVTGVCLDASMVRPGREPRVGALLFPSFSAWQEHLQNDRACDDLSVTLRDGTLTWTSQCRPSDASERTHIVLERSVLGHQVRSEIEAVRTRAGRQLSRDLRTVVARFVGDCTVDMTRTGELLP
jgi:hypothetical protein